MLVVILTISLTAGFVSDDRIVILVAGYAHNHHPCHWYC